VPFPYDTVVQDRVEFRRMAARSTGIASGATFSTDGGLSLQAAYTFSSVRQQGASGWHRSDWDRPHALSALLNLPLGRVWALNAAFRAQSGLPVTPLDAVVHAPATFDPSVLLPRAVFGEPNAARMPLFRRLDLAARRTWTRQTLTWALTLQVVNVLATENAVTYQWQFLNGGADQRPFPRHGLPIIPSIGIDIRW
jgi:hypothetical protein